MEDRVLLLALRGRDAQVIEGLVAKQGHRSIACSDVASLASELAIGAGTALITEESLAGAACGTLEQWLDSQEPWSDFPFILLATKRAGPRPREALALLQRLGNVVVLERPIHSETLASAVKSALRVRRRQYEARARLVALQEAEARLREANASLESRIVERTEDLSLANNQLTQEVAQRERAQAALAQSQKMEAVGQLTGGIAHDFNNLLTAIGGNLELIQRRSDNDRIKLYAGHATQATQRAAKLTHQLLAFSRTQQLSLAPVDLNALVEGMKDLLDRTIGPHIRKQLELSSERPWVMADANQLELAVLNLAINARDAMPNGGALTIRTGLADDAPPELSPGDYGMISVGDTGTGIPPAIVAKVFDPFFTTKPVGKGTGLGLSQVFGIARQSGGTATARNLPGAGACVAIWLPSTAAPSQPTDGTEAERGAIPAEQGAVLVIDDDDGVRNFIVESLELLGYRVTHARSGAEGLRMISHEAPDLLFVDFAMDGLNGAEVAQRAKSIVPDLPIVLATGYADIEGLEDTALIHTVLRKPFQITQLGSVARSALGRH